MIGKQARGPGARTLVLALAVLALVGVGFIMGAGARGDGIDRSVVEQCLPLHDAAALDACLGGGAR